MAGTALSMMKLAKSTIVCLFSFKKVVSFVTPSLNLANSPFWSTISPFSESTRTPIISNPSDRIEPCKLIILFWNVFENLLMSRLCAYSAMAAVNSSALTLPPLILPAASSIEIPNFLAKMVVNGILLLISCKASCPNSAPRLVTCPKTSAKFCKFAPETIDSLPRVSMSGITCCAVRP